MAHDAYPLALHVNKVLKARHALFTAHKRLGAVVLVVTSRHHTRHLEELGQQDEGAPVQRVKLLVHHTKSPRSDNRWADPSKEKHRDNDLGPLRGKQA
jgi:hypothetical protein